MHVPDHRRAFTLIELLVVIAIIGILSAVVLASLSTARDKGSDASVRANLNNARAQAELFYDANASNYSVTAGGTTDVCSSTGLVNNVKGVYSFVTAAATASAAAINVDLATAGNYTRVTCHATATGWAMSAPLKNYSGMTKPVYCVDWTGVSKVTDLGGGGTQPSASAVKCS